jgi:proline iminopeptidase
MPFEKTIEFNNGNFRLQSAISGKGPIALVIGSHKYYPRTFSENLLNNLQLVCADTRGFVPANQTHTEAHFSINETIDDIEALRKLLEAKKIILIGHSVHAFMALEYARQFPDKVSHLVLIASSPIAGQELYEEANRYFEESVCPERKAVFASNMQKFAESGDQSFIARMLAFGPMLWYDYKFNAQDLWDGVTVNTVGASIIWSRMFTNYHTSKALQSVTCPIFLALGRYDYFNPPHLWEKYRNNAVNLTIRVFEKSGHTPQLEEAEHFDNELLKWLAQTKSSTP